MDGSEEEDINLSEEDNEEKIARICSHELAVTFIRKRVPRLSYDYTPRMLRFLIEYHLPHYSELSKSKGFYRDNRKMFDDEGKMRPEIFMRIRDEFNKDIYPMLQEKLRVFEDKPEDTNLSNPNVQQIGKDTYLAAPYLSYDTFLEVLSDGDSNTTFKCDFDALDKEPEPLKPRPLSDSGGLQRCHIRVLSSPMKFDYILKYRYFCDICGKSYTRSANRYESVRGKFVCIGEKINKDKEGNDVIKICKNILYPHEKKHVVRDAYFYDFNYYEGDETRVATGISFKPIPFGMYDAVFFRAPNKAGIPVFFIVDVHEYPPFPLILKKEDQKNHLLTTISVLDRFVEQQSGINIYGLISPKIALLLQATANAIGIKLNHNIHIVGDRATGKSLLLRYWGILLNGGNHLSTNGLSISVPALRGSRKDMLILGRAVKASSVGLLATKKSIHIDEMSTNPVLEENLKTWLNEANFSYDMHESTGATYRRSAHVNLSENIIQEHRKKYIEEVKSEYENIIIVEKDADGKEMKKPVWDDKDDLYLPLDDYDNPYLRRAIEYVRESFTLKQKYWIDGHDIALHDRFPYYYYFVADKDNTKLFEVVEENIRRENISETIELIRVLNNNTMREFFASLKKYEPNNETAWTNDVKKLLEEMKVPLNARVFDTYMAIVKLSRIFNQREKFDKMDYDLLRYIILTTNRKIDVADLAEYKLEFSKTVSLPIKKKENENNTFGINTSIGGDF